MLPALLRHNPRRFSSIHSAYTLRASKQVHDFTTGTLDANPDYYFFLLPFPAFFVSMSYCTVTPKYFALSDFETQLVPEGCDVFFFDLFYFFFFYLFKICLKAKVQFKVQSKVQSSPVQSSPVQSSPVQSSFFPICYKQSSTKRSLHCTSQLE